MDTRVVAVLLLLLMVATVRSSDKSNGVEDPPYELSLLFPQEEFTEFQECLRSFTECTVYVTGGVFNLTVEGVGTDGPRTATDGPCRKYNCDLNIYDSEEGDISCHLQEKSEECNTQLEYQFLRDFSKLNSTCVVLFLSNTTDRFQFDEQGVSDSCNASCSCEESATTTRAVTMDVVTNTVRPMSVETTSTARTTVAAGTAATISTTGRSIENVSSVNTTEATSESVNESSINDTLTKENIGSNATSLWKDNVETRTIIISVLLCGIVVGGILAVFLLCRFRRRNVDPLSRYEDPQSCQQIGVEMTEFKSQSPDKVSRRSYSENCGQDSEAKTPLMSTQDDDERFIITEIISEFPGATPTAEQPQSAGSIH